MEQGVEHVGLQGLLAGFQLDLQIVPFLLDEADRGLMVPQAMRFLVHSLIHMVPSSFNLRSKFSRGSKGSEAPLASFPAGRCEEHRPYPGSLLDGRSEASGYPGGETCLPPSAVVGLGLCRMREWKRISIPCSGEALPSRRDGLWFWISAGGPIRGGTSGSADFGSLGFDCFGDLCCSCGLGTVIKMNGHSEVIN